MLLCAIWQMMKLPLWFPIWWRETAVTVSGQTTTVFSAHVPGFIATVTSQRTKKQNGSVTAGRQHARTIAQVPSDMSQQCCWRSLSPVQGARDLISPTASKGALGRPVVGPSGTDWSSGPPYLNSGQDNAPGSSCPQGFETTH